MQHEQAEHEKRQDRHQQQRLDPHAAIQPFPNAPVAQQRQRRGEACIEADLPGRFAEPGHDEEADHRNQRRRANRADEQKQKDQHPLAGQLRQKSHEMETG
ncbi:hypothetical protein QW131_23725 [Roseibium salinum]|nr:hypothetical protein [Roseibium salinum]